jgi:hypothetical protein
MGLMLIFKCGSIEIWSVSESWSRDYYVYGVSGDPIACPSLGMAFEVAARSIAPTLFIRRRPAGYALTATAE